MKKKRVIGSILLVVLVAFFTVFLATVFQYVGVGVLISYLLVVGVYIVTAFLSIVIFIIVGLLLCD